MILETMSNFGDVAGSPFIVPVAGCLMVLGIVIAGNWSSARKRELESHERLAAIAKGLVPPPTREELALAQTRPAADIVRRRANIRLGGIVLLGAAAGLILFFIALAIVEQERDILCGAAVGLIPLGVGVALLVDARIQSREIDEATQPSSSPSSYTPAH